MKVSTVHNIFKSSNYTNTVTDLWIFLFFSKGNLLSKPHECPAPVYDIMMQCWHSNPEKRILFPEIINELCSLNDFGQRFEAQESQILENFKGKEKRNA